MNQKRKRIIFFAALLVLILSVSSFVLAQTEIFLPLAQLKIVKTIFLPFAALLTDITGEPPPAPDPELHTKIEKIFDSPGYAEARITLTALNAKNNLLQFGLEGRSSESLAIDSDPMQTEKIYGYGGTNFVAQIVDSQGNILSSINTPLPPPSAPPTPSGVAPAPAAAATVGWTQLEPGFSHLWFEEVHCPSSSICYAVANNDSEIKTTDGGTTWTQGASGSASSVHFPADVNTGYAVGAEGKIIKTTNGGSSWTAQTSGTANNLNSVFFSDNDTGYAVGDTGTILKTTNGGTDWTAQTSGTTEGLQRAHFPVSATTGYAVGSTGTILKTTNGGTTWTAQTSGTTEGLQGAWFTDNDTGYAIGNTGTILKTTNGGTTWTAQTSGSGATLSSVHCPVNDTTCYVTIAGAISGRVLKTSNGGTTWAAQTVPNASDGALSSIFCLDNNTCFASGASGQVVKTTDGGQ